MGVRLKILNSMSKRYNTMKRAGKNKRPVQIFLPGRTRNRWISLSFRKMLLSVSCFALVISFLSISFYSSFSGYDSFSTYGDFQNENSYNNENLNKNEMRARLAEISSNNEEKNWKKGNWIVRQIRGSAKQPIKKENTDILKDKLKTRLDQIDTILADTGVLGLNAYKTNDEVSDVDSHPALGIGEGDDSIDPHEGHNHDSFKPISIDSSNLISKADQQLDLLKRLPIGSPVQGRISSHYGMRRSPFSRKRRFHKGMDFGVQWKTPIVATAEGTVIKASWEGAYGKKIVIDHGNGIETHFAHLTKIQVKEGEKICRGQRIGLVGSTGRSTGPHLHYEVHVNGIAQNPKKFVELATYLEMI